MAAAFDHRTSRTGDPQMHTHVAVLGMVKDAAGEVRGLDSRTVFRMSGALSAVYDFYRDKALVRDLNVRLDAREDTGVREVAGVPDSLRRLWSSRRAQITPKVEELKQAYRDAHGREPPRALVAKMAQWATLDTRPEKREPESTEALFARWRATAKAAEDTDLAEVWNRATARRWQAPKSEQTETEIVAAVTARLNKERSSWTVPNVTQLVYQCMDRDPRRSDAEDRARGQRCVNAVLCHDDVLRLTPSLNLDLPAELVRPDGEPVYVRHNSQRYAANSTLREEQYLAGRCQSATSWAIDPVIVDACLATAAGDGPDLSADQVEVVRGVLSSAGDVNVIVGPAGTGKTATMRVLTKAWQANGGSVIGLALSQTAASELAAATGGRAENIAKLLYETGRRKPDRYPRHAAKWTLQRGQLVIMDEAGMTDRRSMVAVTRLCQLAGAKLVLVGDHAQLESPEARGSMRLMASQADTFELGRVHRFVEQWERDASLRLRAGDPAALEEYAARGRIYGGTPAENEQRAVRFALADHLAGRRVFILAGSNERAARVAGTFRAALVGYGLVEADGVNLADGNVAGVGDRIVARRNDRNLTTTKGSFVVNRAVYQVTKRHRRGDLTVAVVDPTSGAADLADHIRLPAGYVAESVQLEYAGTTHAAQGATRYASQSLISASDTANSIYVSLTRGTHANVAHVDSISDPDDGHHHDQTRDPVAVLAAILAAEDNPEDLSALEALSQAVDDAASLATLFPVWQDLESHHSSARWRGYLADTNGERMANWVTSSPAWPTLAARLAELETEGHNPEQVLAAAVAQRDLTGVVDAAATLHYRLEHVGASGAERDQAGGMWTPFLARDITATRFGPALRQVAGRMDQRIGELGERTATEMPEWAWALGPMGDNTVNRMWWIERAAMIASYREAFHVTGHDPIGPRPTQARSEARQWWDHARRALTTTKPHSPVPQASDDQLAAWIDSADQAERTRPEPAHLEEATKTEREVLAHLADTRARRDSLPGREPARNPLSQQVDRLETAASRAGQARIEAEAAHHTYQRWELTTAAVRHTGEAARTELARRHPPTTDTVGRFIHQPSIWVAYQSILAERSLAAKRDSLNLATESSRRLNFRAGQHHDAGEMVEAEAAQTLADRWTDDQDRLKREVAALERQTRELRDELDRRTDRGQAVAEAQRNASPGRRGPDTTDPHGPGRQEPIQNRPTLKL